MIDLYTDASPNGFKVTIALEELGLPYAVHHVRVEAGENRVPAYLAINPHGRIPAIVDRDTGMTLFESCAILLYLAEKTGRLIPSDQKGRWEAVLWLVFHASSMGPILGQRVHFEMFAQEKVWSAINHYRRLSQEILTTLDKRLSDRPHLAGEEFSVADIATFGWTHIAAICGFDFHEHEHLARWHVRVAARPAVQRGIAIPVPATGP